MAEKAKEAAEEVTISRTEIKVPSVTGSPKAQIYVTYTVKGMAPGLVVIDKDKWTKELEVELIRENIKTRRETTPETVTI